MTLQAAWSYLEATPSPGAPVCDNPSGMYCPSCRFAGMSHCAHPEYCGGMRLMKPRGDGEPAQERT